MIEPVVSEVVPLPDCCDLTKLKLVASLAKVAVAATALMPAVVVKLPAGMVLR